MPLPSYLFYGPDILWASVGLSLSSVILTFHFLQLQRVAILERSLISFDVLFSGVWLFEIFYHYGWNTPFSLPWLNGLWLDLVTINVSLGASSVATFPLVFSLFVVSTPLIAYRYITINKAFIIVSVVSVVAFVTWVLLGYQQFWCLCEYKSVFGFYFPDSQIEWIGYVMNSISKLFIVAPAFLFYPSAPWLTRQRIVDWRRIFADIDESKNAQRSPVPLTIARKASEEVLERKCDCRESRALRVESVCPVSPTPQVIF